MELSEQLEAEFCKPAHLQKGVKNPTECEVGITDQLTSLHQVYWYAGCSLFVHNSLIDGCFTKASISSLICIHAHLLSLLGWKCLRTHQNVHS